MITEIEDFFAKGCGRCARFDTPDCSTRLWIDGLVALRGRPQTLLAHQLRHHALQLRGLARSLHAISPLATVARGYAILQDAQGRVIRGIGAVAPGDRLQARLHDGRIDLRVEAKEPEA